MQLEVYDNQGYEFSGSVPEEFRLALTTEYGEHVSKLVDQTLFGEGTTTHTIRGTNVEANSDYMSENYIGLFKLDAPVEICSEYVSNEEKPSYVSLDIEWEKDNTTFSFTFGISPENLSKYQTRIEEYKTTHDQSIAQDIIRKVNNDSQDYVKQYVKTTVFKPGETIEELGSTTYIYPDEKLVLGLERKYPVSTP